MLSSTQSKPQLMWLVSCSPTSWLIVVTGLHRDIASNLLVSSMLQTLQVSDSSSLQGES